MCYWRVRDNHTIPLWLLVVYAALNITPNVFTENISRWEAQRERQRQRKYRMKESGLTLRQEKLWEYKSLIMMKPKALKNSHLCKTFNQKVFIMQGDQLHMVVCFWYLVKCDFYGSVHWTSHFLQSSRKTRSCLSGRVVGSGCTGWRCSTISTGKYIYLCLQQQQQEDLKTSKLS